LTDLLRARGVVVNGAATSGPAPAEATDVASISSPPLREILVQMLRESDNQTAELLTKELGRVRGGAGSTDAGIEAVAAIAAELGLPMTGAVVADGSGLAVENRVTCNLVQTLLDQTGSDGLIAAGLPVAGQTGTLDVRFLNTPVVGRLRAKTGTLNQVTALAGFVDTLQGASLTFSYLVNLPEPDRVSVDDIALQDELGGILITYPEGPPPEVVGPRA
jgi:D-alanyl-D-alanine carboxypeptidase/D-alanyl-D-alanine-endopeptidase (penicillin-binding protein 4)